MNRRLSDWITLSLSLIGSGLIIVAIAGFLNFPGDCDLSTTNCGSERRVASFFVLGLGALWLIYLIVRFTRRLK
jgi:uncharacterized membrane protein YidH (DUF202 family)